MTSSPPCTTLGRSTGSGSAGTQLAIDFAHGHYGLIVDSDHYVAFFQDPAVSAVKGKVAYALPPVGPSGGRRANLWTWSIVMNAHSREKDTAWAFIEWATGRPFLLRSAFEGNMNPTCASVWDDPKFQDPSRGWATSSAWPGNSPAGPAKSWSPRRSITSTWPGAGPELCGRRTWGRAPFKVV